MANPLPPPPLQSDVLRIVKDEKGRIIEAAFSLDFIRWFSQFYERIATFLGTGIFRYGPIVTFAVADATPSVAGGNRFKEVNTAPITITAFDDGTDGQVLIVLFTTGNTTIQDGANLQLAGGVNFVGTANDILTLVRFATVFYEQSRSAN